MEIDGKKYESELHSLTGLGSYLTVILFLFFMLLGIWYVAILSPLIIAVGKESVDYVGYGKFSWKDLRDTLNPWIIIKSYYDRVYKK